jgi:hypothetical protein
MFGEPDQHKLRQNLDGDLVLDERHLMHRRGRLDGNESRQRHSCGIAGSHHDLHAGLHRGRRRVANGQCDGGCECRRGGGQRRVRSGERHERIVCTFDQPLLIWHVVVRGRPGSVDMELRRF